MTAFPTTGLADLGRLAWRAAASLVRDPGSFDGGRVLHDWLRDLTIRHGNANVMLNVIVMRLLLVTDRDLSRHILAQYPHDSGYVAGTLKRRAMSYLAPRALTIADGEAWQRLRPVNERVLCTGRPHDFQTLFLGHVRRAFARPVVSVEDIRACMGRAMLDIVFGAGVAPVDLADDIRVLFGLVENPIARALRGPFERPRLRRLYDTVVNALARDDAAPNASLLGMACTAGRSAMDDELPQQVPHWMFTFSGSGSDLLARGLAMIGSRPDVHARVRAEIAAAGQLDDPGAIDGLEFLEACLLEAARLYPPVTRTFHRSPQGDAAPTPPIAAGTEILHVFSLTDRDTASDPTADAYRPERWLATREQAEAAYPNLFLSGARHCPGRDLILFVCKGAAAMLLGETGLTVTSDRLARDPVPFTFPEATVRFTASSGIR